MTQIDISNIKKIKTNESAKASKSFNLSFLQKEIHLRGKKINDSKKERFYRQLGVLFFSGIDIGGALEIIIEGEKLSNVRQIYSKVLQDVINGEAFSKALFNTGFFSDYEYYSIKVGEESGRLQEVLSELAGFFELRSQQRRQLTGALSYPVLVMIVAIGAVIFMLNVVVPMFANVFQRFGGELPALTQNVLALSVWLKGHLLMCFIFIICTIALMVYIKRFDWFRKYSSSLLLKIPYLGELISNIIHARFCHSVSLLILSQVPLLDALDMVKKMIGFYPFKVAIENVENHIISGKHMYEGMAKQKVFDHRLVSITKVGEEINQVGQLYSKLYAQYTDEVKHMTGLLGNMLEPIMIVFVGMLVMVILIAMYLPLFQLSTNIY
jgi:type IV pilus assembly protein PilC